MRAATTFYEALGLRRLYGGAEASFTSYAVGEQYLNLQHAEPDDEPRRWGRVIFYVGDVDGMHARATAAGLSPLFPPRDASWGERYFHLRDPDGHELSFARRLVRGPKHPTR
jgi:catechol 2,3-dioxygenase-like lactoylglutathione lyase family enzyme